MHRTLVAIAILVGVLSIAATGLWCVAALTWGSVFDRPEAFRYLALLAMGPLSILPYGVLGRTRPKRAAGLYLGGAFAAFVWHLSYVQYDGFRKFFSASPPFETWVPITLICLPMAALGIGFGWVGFRLETDESRVKPDPPPRWPHVYIGGILLLVGISFGADLWVASKHAWILSVTPQGKPTTTLRFDTWERARNIDEVLGRMIDPLFENPPAGDQVTLGKYELKGPGSGGRTHTFVLTLDRTRMPNVDWVFRNGTWLSGDPAHDPLMRKFANARMGVVTGIWVTVRENAPPGR